MILVFRIILLTFVLLVPSLNETKTQEWQWEWAKKTHENVIGPELKVLTSGASSNKNMPW